MRGHFNLKHDIYTGLVTFGNLVGDDADAFAVAHLPIRNFKGADPGRIIAHDVVEHSVAHRYKRHVTVEEELRALGAIMFVRPNADIRYDVPNTLAYLHRPIAQVPRTMRHHINDNSGPVFELDDLRDLCEREDVHLDDNTLAMANHHIRWGQLQKEWQFKGDQCAAWNAFHFIQENVIEVLEGIWRAESAGASVYFDTVMGIFRWRRKWTT